MSLSVRTRFEVFKRDRFTCSYCGRTPPNVLLEVDHIVPLAAGGSDDITNLTTACWDCNHGKAARLLEEGTAPVVSQAVVDDLRERVEQASAYVELVGQQSALIDKQVHLINETWASVFDAPVIEEDGVAKWRFDQGRFPDDRSLRTFLRRISLHEIVAAVDIAGTRFRVPDEWACRFFYKICWRRIKGETGPIDGPAPAQDTRDEELSDLANELIGAHVEINALREELAESHETLNDLRLTIERLREAAGRS